MVPAPYHQQGLKSPSRTSLRTYILFFSILVSFVSFAVVFSITTIVYQNSIENNAHWVAKELSHQISHAIPLLMAKGWSRDELIHYHTNPHPNSPTSYSIQIYRTRIVETMYGRSDLPPDPLVEQACATGATMEAKQALAFDTIYPLAATEVCIGCHKNARRGEVLGALKIRQNIEPMVRDAGKKLFGFFLFLSPVPILLAGFIARRANDRISRSISHLQEKMVDINNVQDLTRLELTGIQPSFAEFDRVFAEIDTLVKRIRGVSIDKDTLEFQIQILEKFIITSEVLRDWKEHVSSLLLEINRVIDAYALFCIFQVEEERYDIEIFWRSRPSESARERFEQIVLRDIREKNPKLAALPDLQFTHTVADHDGPILEVGDTGINLQTKSLVLQLPQIGGMVGIGVQCEQMRDTIRTLVIDSVLTTLLNVVGSIKAIDKYTRDLEYFATRDPLTNLYNQRAFWDLIGYEIGRAERYHYTFSLLVMDLDNFKNINDHHGHTVGDRYLAAFAVQVAESLRKGDIFARYGGDEFAVILPDADEEHAFLAANRIREVIEELCIITSDGSKAKCTASIGLAVYPIHARNEKDLFFFADNMTYRAKGAGKNRVILPAEYDLIEVFRETGEKARLVMAAIEENRVIPYFQPIAPLRAGLPESCEVLCRIETAEGVVAASEFIEIAENLGVVGKLDFILMEKAFMKAREENYQGNLFINLSPKTMIIDEFITGMTRLTNEYGIEHGRVVFELTERETVKNLSLLEKFVRELKHQGFKFAIDDFGSGFSSFHYIRSFPIDYVKIEGVFVRNMLNDYRDMAFVKTLTTLAREFRIDTIAEYIESEEILDAVRELGIDYAQGYHVGHPSPTFSAAPPFE